MSKLGDGVSFTTFLDSLPQKQYIKCPHCGKEALVDTSVVLTSYPPQYSYHCEHCNERGYIYCHELSSLDVTEYSTKCCVCGEEIKYTGTEKPILCNKCKEVILELRRGKK